MDRIAARDMIALRELCDRHSVGLYGLALRILPESQAAAVVAQVFVEAWHEAPSYDVGLCTPAAWLIERTRTRAIARRRFLGIQGESRDPIVSPASEVGRALAELSTEQRWFIEQTYFFGSTRAELAQRSGLSPNVVAECLSQGMRTLRDLLQQSALKHKSLVEADLIAVNDGVGSTPRTP